jgi:hypothetical protein
MGKYEKGGKTFNDTELLARWKKGESIGFTGLAHLKAKGLIPRADGEKRKSQKYMEKGGKINNMEEKIIIDGKEVTRDEFTNVYQEANYGKYYFNLKPKKIEYNGSDYQLIEAVNDYNRMTSPYYNDGSLKGNYMKAIVDNAFNEIPIRKFGIAYRKNIDSYFSAENNRERLTRGMDWKELASYIISDQDSVFYEEEKFRAFAKDLGIDIASKKMEKGGKINNMDNKKALNGSTGGMLVGNRHSEGGIKAINKSNNQPLEMEGGEVVITRNAVTDNKKHEFEGKMLTNREILSKINESGGGVSFADGGSVSDCACKGHKYKFGGKIMTDYQIVTEMRNKYPKDFEKGMKEESSEHSKTFGGLKKGKLTTKEATELVVAEHLRKKPNYYKMYKMGGMLTIVDKVLPSLDEFVYVGEPIMSPFVGENSLYYKVQEMGNGVYNYFKDANKKSTKITPLIAYKTYLYDTFGIVFSSLPPKIQNGLIMGKQELIDNYINS